MNLQKLLTFAAVAVTLPGAALAAQTTTTFQVTALVTSACSVNASNLDFGSYDPLSVVDDTITTNINVACTLLTPYAIKLNGGSVNSNISARKMANGADRLDYQLYTSALMTTIWGDAVTGSTVTGTGLGVSTPHTVFGRIAALQNVSAGSYADTVTVTVEF